VKRSILTLPLMLVLLFGISLAIPALDDPDTPYDESEELPYDITPTPSIEVLAQSARPLRASLGLASPLQFGSITQSEEARTNTDKLQAPSISESPTILGHSLRW